MKYGGILERARGLIHNPRGGEASYGTNDCQRGKALLGVFQGSGKEGGCERGDERNEPPSIIKSRFLLPHLPHSTAAATAQ